MHPKERDFGNQFLANIREVDAIVHVVRCFEDPNVIHVDGSIDPLRDIETIDLELIFADLEVLERRISKTAKSARMDKEAAKELEFQERLKKTARGRKRCHPDGAAERGRGEMDRRVQPADQ